jgi:hypothetical protein
MGVRIDGGQFSSSQPRTSSRNSSKFCIVYSLFPDDSLLCSKQSKRFDRQKDGLFFPAPSLHQIHNFADGVEVPSTLVFSKPSLLS